MAACTRAAASPELADPSPPTIGPRFSLIATQGAPSPTFYPRSSIQGLVKVDTFSYDLSACIVQMEFKLHSQRCCDAARHATTQ